MLHLEAGPLEQHLSSLPCQVQRCTGWISVQFGITSCSHSEKGNQLAITSCTIPDCRREEWFQPCQIPCGWTQPLQVLLGQKDFPVTPSQVPPCSWKRRWMVTRGSGGEEGSMRRCFRETQRILLCGWAEQLFHFYPHFQFAFVSDGETQTLAWPAHLEEPNNWHTMHFPASQNAVKHHLFSQINLVLVNHPLAWPELTTHFQGVYIFIPRHLANRSLAGCALLQGGCSSSRVGQMMNHHFSDVHLHSIDLITCGWASICSSYIMANARDINSLLPPSYHNHSYKWLNVLGKETFLFIRSILLLNTNLWNTEKDLLIWVKCILHLLCIAIVKAIKYPWKKKRRKVCFYS